MQGIAHPNISSVTNLQKIMLLPLLAVLLAETAQGVLKPLLLINLPLPPSVTSLFLFQSKICSCPCYHYLPTLVEGISLSWGAFCFSDLLFSSVLTAEAVSIYCAAHRDLLLVGDIFILPPQHRRDSLRFIPDSPKMSAVAKVTENSNMSICNRNSSLQGTRNRRRRGEVYLPCELLPS